MKNKKGFTLIELLAVIVVLAIIALIATPIVMNTIKNAKKGAAERSADNYVKAVEQKVAESRIDGTKISNGTYNIQPDGNLCPASGCGENDKDKITIDMSGTKPTSGTVTISNGGVSQNETTMTVGDYSVSYDDSKSNFVAQEIYKGVLCTTNTTKVSTLIYSPSKTTSQEVGLLASEASSKYDIGVTYTCELGDGESNTFYVLEENGDNISLIMDKNIDSNGKGTTSGNTVSWISAEDWATAGGVVTDAMKNDSGACQLGGLCLTNEYGPITAENYLKSSTTTWTKLTESQISLPSASQIAAASRKTFTNNLISGLSKWLYGNLYLNDIKPYGYWTSTPDASTYNRAWSVSCNGGLDLGVDKGGNNGVRPVITVSKAQLG